MFLLNEFAYRDDAAAALARSVGVGLRAAVLRRAAASLIVSGGAAPRPLFRALRTVPLPWCSITIMPSDEPLGLAANEQDDAEAIRRELATGAPGFASFVSLRGAAAAPRADWRETPPVRRPFDAVVLGMGADGHTASLYPDSPDIARALSSADECVVQAVPRLRDPRITLTVRALLDSREVNLLFFGATKRQVLVQALGPGPTEEYPVRALLRQDAVPVNVYWAP